MGIVTLKKDTQTAVFSWITEDDTMQVDIKVDQMSKQKGKMSKSAAREFWHMLKEQGYTEDQSDPLTKKQIQKMTVKGQCPDCGKESIGVSGTWKCDVCKAEFLVTPTSVTRIGHASS